MSFGATARWSPLVAAWACAACFAPQIGEGTIQCGSDRSCPPGFACGIDDRCYSRGAPKGPLAPTGLTARGISEYQIDLRWQPAASVAPVQLYRIYRDGILVGEVAGSRYEDAASGLAPAGRHAYTVVARDNEGNESGPSEQVLASTLAAGESEYVARRAETAPTVDGDLSDLASADAAVLLLLKGGNRVTLRALWDRQALYLGYEVSDTELNHQTNGEETKRDGKIYPDDGIEWFVDADGDGATPRPACPAYVDSRDFQGLVNILNTQGDARGNDIDFSPDHLAWGPIGAWQSAVKLGGTVNDNRDADVGYTVEIRIPWAALELAPPPSAGSVIRLGLAANDRDAAGYIGNALWPSVVSGCFQNASRWQAVRLSE